MYIYYKVIAYPFICSGTLEKQFEIGYDDIAF